MTPFIPHDPRFSLLKAVKVIRVQLEKPRRCFQWPMPLNGFDSISTRHSLLNRLKDWGDQASWQVFFERYCELIYNVAIKAGLTAPEAEEVVQETIISVARKIPEFKADPSAGSFSAWLMQLTRWRIADQFRRRGKFSVHSAARHGDAPASDDTAQTSVTDRIPDPDLPQLERVWTEEWERHLMTEALGRIKLQISARQYQVFDLHVLQQLSVQQTAATLRISTASVYMAKYRVSRMLKRELAQMRKKGLPHH